MRLSQLRLSGYRNLRDQDLELPAEGVAIVGRNAQGKTNLLEAIHYLEAFRSFRGSRDEQIIRFGEDVFRVEAHVAAGPSSTGSASSGSASSGSATTRHERPGPVISAAYEASTRRKRITVDGQVVTRIGDAIGRLGVVLFTPDDVRLVTDGPSERRRFLDILLSLNDPDYLGALQRYRQALLRRNAVLRKRGTSAAVAAWDAILVESGSRVLSGRIRWMARWSGLFTEYCAEVSGGSGARMVHVPGVRGMPPIASDLGVATRPDGGNAGESNLGERRHAIGLTPAPGALGEEVAMAFEKALRSASDEERQRGTTLVGPHRDDVRFAMFTEDGETDAREFGSGGQRRTVALSLRLLEAATVRHDRGHEPLLLLDDVFAELDEDRSHRVLRLLDRVVPGQVILTAPRESDVRFRGEMLQRRYMRDGEVTE